MNRRQGDEPIPGYRLIRHLGTGNFGEVWEAEAPGKIRVALKFIDLSGREGSLEWRALERIRNIRCTQLVSIIAYWLKGSDGQMLEDTSISSLSAAAASPDQAASIGGTLFVGASGQEVQPVELIVAMTLGTKNLSKLLEECLKQQQQEKGIRPKLIERGKNNPVALPKLTTELNDLLKTLPDSAAAKSLLQEWTKLEELREKGENNPELKEIDEAIAEGRKAKSAVGLITRSAAYILRANYENDFGYTPRNRLDDLAAALAGARQAEELLHAEQGDSLGKLGEYFCHLTAGNAYEDLAWLAEKDPAENMNKAIEEFAVAATANPNEAQPLSSIGRCYYKALAETYLPADALKKRDGVAPLKDEAAVMEECERALKDALGKDPRMVEANYYLAQLYQYRTGACFGQYEDDSHDKAALAKAKQAYEEADKQYKAAWDLAQQQELPQRAIYAAAWAMFPVKDYDYHFKWPEAAPQPEQALRDRADLLETLPPPPGKALDAKKVAAWIRGQIDEAAGNRDKALQIYSNALLPDRGDLTGKDVQLLVARATCHNSIAKSARDANQTAKAVQECKDALGDAVAAEKVAFYRNDMARAREQAFLAHKCLYLTATAPANRIAMYQCCLEDLTTLEELAPRRPNEWQWCGGFAREVLLTEIPQHPKSQQLQDYSDLIYWANRAVETCKRKASREKMTNYLLEPGSKLAKKFAREKFKAPLPLPTQWGARTTDEWQHLLATLP